MAATPAGVDLGQPGTLLADLDGDGRGDLITSSPSRTSIWSLAAPGDIPGGRAGLDPASYTTHAAPAFPLTDPQVRLLDLDGDHQADLLCAGSPPLMAFGDGPGGFTGLHPVPTGSQLPIQDFTNPRVQLADMTGDGLTDIVLIHNHAVTYWPNLDYGRFGPPVAMTDPLAPRPGGSRVGRWLSILLRQDERLFMSNRFALYWTLRASAAAVMPP
jgi:hypothetical protein